MRKAFMIPAVLVLALAAGGCNSQTAKDWLARVVAAVNLVKSSLQEARETIRVGCSALNIREVEAEQIGEQCRRTVVGIKAGVVAVCQNVDLLTDNEVGNYVKSIGTAVKSAQQACK